MACKGYCLMHYARVKRYGTLKTVRKTKDFWAKVVKGSPTECWPWTGYVRPSNGHGLSMYKGHPTHASRKAWILTNGFVPSNLCVCHKCDNKLCCNPDHMYLGTAIDNVLDQFEKPAFEQRGARDVTRRFLLSNDQLLELWEMRRGGATLKACAVRFGVTFQTIARYITYIRKNKLERNRREKEMRHSVP